MWEAGQIFLSASDTGRVHLYTGGDVQVYADTALVLLYAQPVSRIVRLTIDDETTVTVRLGYPPSPLPEPVADLMRANSSPVSTCPTPAAGARSGSSPKVHLREIGVPPQRGWTSAIRQLVLQAPAPRHREGARLSRQDRHPPGHRSRWDLEPIRRRRPPAVKRGYLRWGHRTPLVLNVDDVKLGAVPSL